MASIRLPRITTAQRTALVLSLGEIVYDTDNNSFYGGDGSTSGGFLIGGSLAAATIKTLYESNANTNAFTDAEQTKLGYITVTGAIDLDTIGSGISTNATNIANEITNRTNADSAIQSQVTANNAKVSASGSIATHSDVDLTVLANNDILQYNSTSGDFEPKALNELSGMLHSSLSLDDGTNPHNTTKADVGLGNADNTSDADKPISTATQTALDLKIGEFYETTSKNLKSWDATFNYTGSDLNTITYTDGVDTITKTFNYTGSDLTSIVLSGDTPAGIDLTKTLSYTTGSLTSIIYS